MEKADRTDEQLKMLLGGIGSLLSFLLESIQIDNVSVFNQMENRLK